MHPIEESISMAPKFVPNMIQQPKAEAKVCETAAGSLRVKHILNFFVLMLISQAGWGNKWTCNLRHRVIVIRK